MADLLTYSVVVAAPADHDVVSRELVVSVNGETHPTMIFAGPATDLGTVSAAQDADVVLTLVDIDDAGNRSEPCVVRFVAADTLPPGVPSGVSVTLVGETAVVTPDVTPEPEAPADESTTDGNA